MQHSATHPAKANMLRLPPQLTPFIGRTKEVGEISERLADPACRLLTLVGPGGIGKTRLSIQVAAQMADTFAQGVYFVPLQAVQSANFLLTAIADALNIPSSGQSEPLVQLLRYLSDKDMLLVLDNFEQLLAEDGAALLAQILASTHEVKLLVTSREVLNLQEEWLYPIQGLPFPAPPPPPGASRFRDARLPSEAPEEGRSARSAASPSEVQGRTGGGEPHPPTPSPKRTPLQARRRAGGESPRPVSGRGRGWGPAGVEDEPKANLSALEPSEGEGVATYAAIQLFTERARRVRPDFSLVVDQADVIRICQLVEGMPLALELAASWTKTLPCPVIAAEIERHLDFLATRLRDVPDRQRSMRAVFDHSWQLLSEEEQNVFKRLAVFRGGFRREAAERVAGASLAALSALVDKSLLRWEPNGRYQVHELLRQYAAERLAQSPEDVGRMYDRHCAYYADFLQERAKEVIGARQREVIREFTAELENIRAAWRWAVAQERIMDLQKAAYPYSVFCDVQSRYREVAGAFEQAIQSLDKAAPSRQKELSLALLLSFLGWDYIRLGRLESAQTVFERSWAIFNSLDIPPPQGFSTDPLNGLALVAHILGNYVEAAKLGEEARRRHEAQVDKLNLQLTYYVLASTAFAEGQFETARDYNQQAYILAKETDHRWFTAYVLDQMGNVARALGDYAQARQHYQASYAIREEFDDPGGMAVALNHLGKVATLQKDYVEAEQLYQQSLAIYQKIYDRGGLATALAGLGEVACAVGEPQAARRYFQQALQITAEMQFVPLTLSILSGIGELLSQTSQLEWGLELLALVLHHPASDHETKARVQQRLTRNAAALPSDAFAAVMQRGASSDLETIVTSVLTEWAAPFQAEEQGARSGGAGEKIVTSAPALRRAGLASETPASLRRPLKRGGASGVPPRSPALAEPLTPRELEVLHLIAEGMTNQQIADRLIISVGTAKFYTSQIYSKLNVSNRTQAVARARELNLLS